MVEKACTMEMLEFPDMTDGWACSACDGQFKATQQFERNTYCPKCGSVITGWDSEYVEG